LNALASWSVQLKLFLQHYYQNASEEYFVQAYQTASLLQHYHNTNVMPAIMTVDFSSRHALADLIRHALTQYSADSLTLDNPILSLHMKF
jgi:hypothetical protein